MTWNLDVTTSIEAREQISGIINENKIFCSNCVCSFRPMHTMPMPLYTWNTNNSLIQTKGITCNVDSQVDITSLEKVTSQNGFLDLITVSVAFFYISWMWANWTHTHAHSMNRSKRFCLQLKAVWLHSESFNHSSSTLRFEVSARQRQATLLRRWRFGMSSFSSADNSSIKQDNPPNRVMFEILKIAEIVHVL